MSSNQQTGKFFIKISLFMVLLIIIALSTALFLFLSIAKQSILQSHHNNYIQVIQNLNESTKKQINNNKNRLFELTKQINLNEKNKYTLGTKLYNLVLRNRNLNRLSLIDKNGKIIATVTEDKIDTRDYIKAPEYIQKAVQKNKDYKTFLQYEKKQIFISIPILSKNQEYLYSFAGHFNLNSIIKFIKQLQKTTEYEIDFLDKNNFSLIHNRTIKNTMMIETIRGGDNNTSLIFDKGKHYYVTSELDPKLNFAYAIKHPKSKALKGLTQIKTRAITILLLISIIFFLIGILLSKLISKPLQTIHEGVKQFSTGDFSHRIIIKNEDEFGLLADTLNDMALDIKNLIELKQKTEQLVTISNLAVSLNHEVKNPLASVNLSAGIIKRKCDPENKIVIKSCGTIEEQTARLSQLIINLSEMTEPVLVDYVEGTKMFQLSFESKKEQ